ncbi:protein spartin [Agrilus planipennis]|uniref:Protein spartin n=1 Tax=Agrilus planipennis TaxID=224129 RepID=A0A1W4X7E6_AGRPL|nr:protein spartin [Agrilus planipennis]XP_018331960.1 protein spartin [Agrilus planipennis]
MGNSSSSSEWIETFNTIKASHDKAYHIIEEAISLEEQEKPNEAIEKYKEGVNIIDGALSVQVTMPESADFRWEQACRMIQKMKRTRGEVLTRIQCIQSAPGFMQHEPPPLYDDVVGPETQPTQMYQEITSAAHNLANDIQSAEATEVIYSYDNVKLYFISPDGTVCQTSQPQQMIIGLVESKKENEPSKYFLQVGGWVYPLVPGVTVCYRTDYGAFIFPDTETEIPGSSVGLILPQEADPSAYELLESILHGLIGQTPTLQRIRKDISERISEKIVTGAAYLSEGLVKGAQKASDYLNQKTPQLIQKITPADQSASIPKSVSKTAEIAHSATGTAASVTGYIAEKVGLATMALGHYLAPHVQSQGSKLLKTGFKMTDEEANARMNSILTVAAGAVEGFSTVYRGLETSASILGRNLSNNTVKVVEHKYGSPAGNLASNTLGAGGNVWNVYSNSKNFTPKGLVKNTAKGTGKAMIADKRLLLRINGNASTSGDTQTRNTVAVSDLQTLYPNVENLRDMEASTPYVSITNTDISNTVTSSPYSKTELSDELPKKEP